MSTLIRNGHIEADDYAPLADDAALPASGRHIVSLARWQQQRTALAAAAARIGIAVPNTVDLATVIDDLLQQPLIELHFPAFADGRAYSQARLLRDRYRYTGEIRASGEAVVLDQLQSMLRCGFTSFALRQDQNPQRCLDAHHAFDLAYQAVGDDLPLVKRLRSRNATTVAPIE